MSRSIRLLNLLQRLREYRHPVTAKPLLNTYRLACVVCIVILKL